MRFVRAVFWIAAAGAAGAMLVWLARVRPSEDLPLKLGPNDQLEQEPLLVQETTHAHAPGPASPGAREQKIIVEQREKTPPEHAPAKFQPHPDTERRRAMHQSRQLLETARAAARSGDVVRLRQIVEEGGRDPDTARDNAHWLVAYRLVLQCVESMNAQTQAAGAQFVRDQAGSPLRREVRRYCQVNDETTSLN